MNRWLWVSLPYATYGIRIENGRVAEAAPIAHWMIGKDEHTVMAWLFKKNARLIWLQEENP